jgi:hypothetical protein
MRYLKSFFKFEDSQLIKEDFEKDENIDPYDFYMGRLLYLYSSIPVPKQKARIALDLMLQKEYNLNEDVDLNDVEVDFQDKIRIIDYLNSLLKNTEIRGDNFEGFLCGLFKGTLSTSKSSKHDITIGDVNWRVKYTEFGDYNPEIGSFKDILSKSDVEIEYTFKSGLTAKYKIVDFVRQFGGLTDILRNEPSTKIYDQNQWNIYKKIILDVIFDSDQMKNFGGVITGTTNNKIPKEGNPLESISEIILNIIEKDKLRDLFFKGFINQPKKGGKESPYILRLNKKYKLEEYSTTRIIKLPTLPTLKELENHFNEVERKEWGTDVFGKITWKIRPDVFDNIKANRKHIISKLEEWDKKWDELGL